MTATVEDISTDVDWLTLIDFEADVPCESILGCDNAADWKSIHPCCATITLLCDECKTKVDIWVRENTGGLRPFRCMPCGAESFNYSDLVRWERL